jgi:hypothetical protein
MLDETEQAMMHYAAFKRRCRREQLITTHFNILKRNLNNLQIREKEVQK